MPPFCVLSLPYPVSSAEPEILVNILHKRITMQLLWRHFDWRHRTFFNVQTQQSSRQQNQRLRGIFFHDSNHPIRLQFRAEPVHQQAPITNYPHPATARRTPDAAWTPTPNWAAHVLWKSLLATEPFKMMVSIAQHRTCGSNPKASILDILYQLVNGVGDHFRCVAMIKDLEFQPVKAGQSIECAHPQITILGLDESFDGVLWQAIICRPSRDAIVRRGMGRSLLPG